MKLLKIQKTVKVKLLKMHSIYIDDIKYKVNLAITDEEQTKGLQGVEKLGEYEGMLFMYNKPQTVSFWMKDCLIDLDLVFIDDDGEVISVRRGRAGNETAIKEDGVKYVLEINADSDVFPGDEVDLEDVEDINLEDDEEYQKMSVLDNDGKTQMELDGNERIFSRKDTVILARLAKRAFKSKSDSDYESLGKKAFKFIKIQNELEQEFA